MRKSNACARSCRLDNIQRLETNVGNIFSTTAWELDMLDPSSERCQRCMNACNDIKDAALITYRLITCRYPSERYL